jgi:glutathionyl-hydroquinone reductase
MKMLTRRSGWRFATSDEKLPGKNTIPDPLHPQFTHLREIYFSNDPEYKGRFTVPILYDKKNKLIVSNEVRLLEMCHYVLVLTKKKERRDHSHALL